MHEEAAPASDEGRKTASDEGRKAASGKGPLTLAVKPLDLPGIDSLGDRDLLVLVGKEERPLQGLGGLADWRLCGALTRIIKRSLFSGEEGETLLTTTGGRLPMGRIFLLGVGKGESPGASLEKGLKIVAKAGATDLALSPAARGEELVPRVEALATAAHRAGISRLTLLAEDPQPTKKALVVVEANHPWAKLEGVL